MHILVAGGTSVIAQHWLRRALNNEQHDVSLIGRDISALEEIKSDLAVRSPASKVELYCLNFLDTVSVTDLLTTITSKKSVDVALVAFGTMPQQSQVQEDLALCHESMQINSISACIFCEALSAHMVQTGGRLGVISSVAGDRGRKSNYVYGSAKSMVSTYAEGLQHRFANSPLAITLIKPGPVLTPMTSELRPLPLGIVSPDIVARDIERAFAKGTRVVFTPSRWRWIMLVIRLIPFHVFKRLNI